MCDRLRRHDTFPQWLQPFPRFVIERISVNAIFRATKMYSCRFNCAQLRIIIIFSNVRFIYNAPGRICFAYTIERYASIIHISSDLFLDVCARYVFLASYYWAPSELATNRTELHLSRLSITF